MHEPEPAERETSQVLSKVFGSLDEDGVNKMEVAQILGISTSELESLIFGLSVAEGLGKNPNKSRNRGHLSVIK